MGIIGDISRIGLRRTILFLVSMLLGALGIWQPYDLAKTPPVRQVGEFGARLQAAVAAVPGASLKTIGQVRYERFSVPLWCVSVVPAGEIKHRVLLTGGVHGSEYVGPEAVLRFLEKLGQSPGLYSDTAFDLIPMVNPWGWAYDRRGNRNGQDINRDFASFKTQESVIIRDFAAGKKYDLIVDFHQDGGAEGFYLFRLANADLPRCQRAIEAVRAAGYPIERDTWKMFVLKTDDGFIHGPMWMLKVARLSHYFLSMTNYFRLAGYPQVFVFEASGNLPIAVSVGMHHAALDALLKDMNAE